MAVVVSDVRVVRDHDLVIVLPSADERSDQVIIDGATQDPAVRLALAQTESVHPETPHRWCFRRAQADNAAYLDETRAQVLLVNDPSANIVVADQGIVVVDGVSEILALKLRGSFAALRVSTAARLVTPLVDFLADKKIVYHRPRHILERLRPPALSFNECTQLLVHYFDVRATDITVLPGGRGPTVFRVEDETGRTVVVKVLGRDRQKARLRAQIAAACDSFPRPMPLVRHDERTVGDYLVEVCGDLLVVEEFLRPAHPPLLNADYYYNFGRNLGALHTELLQIQRSGDVDTLRLASPVTSTFVQLALIDFELALRSNVSGRLGSISSDDAGLLLSQLGVLRRSGYSRVLASLERQLVHGDLSVLHSFQSERGELRLIDIETLSCAPRVTDFPIALVGRGGGAPSEYLPGTFDALITGYNETVARALTSEEVELVKLLVVHRFIQMALVRTVRHPAGDQLGTARMLDSLRTFVAEQEADPRRFDRRRLQVREPDPTPFVINRPVKVLTSTMVPEIGAPQREPALAAALLRNALYSHLASPARSRVLERVVALDSLLLQLQAYLRERYPKLVVLNVSLFGSYLFSEVPHDIDVLVVVQGNHYGLEEIPIDDLGANSAGLCESVGRIGISIKGLANLSSGVVDANAGIAGEAQRIVLDRTTVALGRRHVVLDGAEFASNPDLWSANVLAVVSDLLRNVYNRLYMGQNLRALSPQEKTAKLLSRVYEAAAYLADCDPRATVTPQRALGAMHKEQGGAFGYPDAVRLWRELLLDYQLAVRRQRRASVTRADRTSCRPVAPLLTDEDAVQIGDLVRIARDQLDAGTISPLVPVVARIVGRDGAIVATASRAPTDRGGSALTPHAEISAIRMAEQAGFRDWTQATLYTLLEPCFWCTRAITEFYSISRVVYGIEDPTLPPYVDSNRACAWHGVESNVAGTEATRQALLELFGTHRRHVQYGSDRDRRLKRRTAALVALLSDSYRRTTGRTLQLAYLDADELAHDDAAVLSFWERELAWFRQVRRPDSSAVLVIEGDEEARSTALIRVFGKGAWPGRVLQLKAGADPSADDTSILANGDEAFVFDYDNTIASPDEPLADVTATELARLLCNGHPVGIATTRRLASMPRRGVQAASAILEAIRRDKNVPYETNCAAMTNLFLFVERGAQKFRFVLKGGSLIPVRDGEFGREFTDQQYEAIRQAAEGIVKYSADTSRVDGPVERGTATVRFHFAMAPSAYASLRAAAGTVERILSETGQFTEPPIVTQYRNRLTVSACSKARAVTHLRSEVGVQHIHYYGDDPKGTDRSIFELQGELDGLECVRVGGPWQTSAHMRAVAQGSDLQGWNPLWALSQSAVRRFVAARLRRYWRATRLPEEWVLPIVEVLGRLHREPETALRVVTQQYPQLADPRSSFHEALRAFRERKVQRLVRRFAPYVRGPVFMDFGGRVPDMAREVLRVCPGVDRVILSDITHPPDVEDPRIEVLWQEQPDRTPMDRRCLNTILLSMVLHHLERAVRRRVLSQLLGLLESGGRVLLIEDSFPSDGDLQQSDDLVASFMKLSWSERFGAIAFLDWFGNAVTRNRRGVEYPLAYETMEAWETVFHSFGCTTVHSEFVGGPSDDVDLMPPKAFLVFERH